jgi:deoxyribodipyrimidine photo-lyase
MDANSPGRDTYLEELIVRRELGINFVYYNKYYDLIDAIPPWAAATLKKHQLIKINLYSRRELRDLGHMCFTNAAQNELVTTGRYINICDVLVKKKY